MSNIRPIWNDGQALTTPELQRPCDVAAYAADDPMAFLLDFSASGKTVTPLNDDGSTNDAPLLIVPSSTSGAVELEPAHLMVRSSTDSFTVNLAAGSGDGLDSPLVTANFSGSTRIDLLYATLSRSTPADISSPPAGSIYTGFGLANTGVGAQQNRKIKDVSSGNITSQTINVYDVPTITLTILAGTPGAGVPPALPGDSSSAWNIPLANITVATSYSSGTAVTQSQITPVWERSWISPTRRRLLEVPTFYSGSASEKLTSHVSERWGSGHRFFTHLKLVSSTPNATTAGSAIILDNSIDWRNRFVSFKVSWLGSGVTAIEGTAATNASEIYTAESVIWTGPGATPFVTSMTYVSVGPSKIQFFVDTAGKLRFGRAGSLVDGTNGDLLVLRVEATDKLTTQV